jgi:hypothetical protein
MQGYACPQDGLANQFPGRDRTGRDTKHKVGKMVVTNNEGRRTRSEVSHPGTKANGFADKLEHCGYAMRKETKMPAQKWPPGVLYREMRAKRGPVSHKLTRGNPKRSVSFFSVR